MAKPTWMELRGEWGDLLRKAEAIVNTAVGEGRAMTDDEARSYRETVSASHSLMVEVHEAERRDGIEYIGGVRTRVRFGESTPRRPW